ncbi:M64 family metallopeptidase [Streptomyces lydicus]|uniref:M64 family metallopeptidase n=1 Tax=Streptomyces lydicus TaxID=47763 RepID=UPI0036FC3378
MTTNDGTVIDVTKILDHGPDTDRWNLVILSEGYQSAELTNFHLHAVEFTTKLLKAAPFDSLADAINVHRVDVASTDSGADSPATCGGATTGPGTAARTYFDATYCGDGQTRRLLTINQTTAQSVATTQVPNTQAIVVIVNSTEFGGSGGRAAVFSLDPAGLEIGLHELGHGAFNLADEYCLAGTAFNNHPTTEPLEPNVTIGTTPATIKWGFLIDPATQVPTTSNGDCTTCDPNPSPVPVGTLGAFEGAHFFHCGVFRGEFDCRMRTLGTDFCLNCNRQISLVLNPFLPP